MPGIPTRFCPQLEALEDRRLMAASLSANLSNGILNIEGTEKADRITVRQINGRVSVDGISIGVGVYQQASVAAGVVNRVKVYGLGGDDFIYLDSERTTGQQALSMPATIYGGEGHDTIRAGWGSDWINGGNGSDALYGNRGNDILIGEASADMLYGDDGDDGIWAGAGNDWIEGGAGNDSLYGEEGNDNLDGGLGLDITMGGAGFDSYRDDFDLSKPFYNGAAPEDVIQQNSPTCATLSTLAEMAQRGWNLAGQVTNAGNGLYDVRLRKTGGFYLERVAFNGTWNDNDPAPARDAQGRNVQEFWTILFQRARLQLYGINYRTELTAAQWDAANVTSGHLLLDAGEALYNYTGKLADYTYANQANPQTLFNQFQAGRLIVLTTPGTGSNTTLDAASGVVGWHAYALTRMYQANGQWMLELYNPWGKDGSGTPRDGRNDGFLTITWTELTKFFKSIRVA